MTSRRAPTLCVLIAIALSVGWARLSAESPAQTAEPRAGTAPAPADRAMSFVREVAQALGRRDRAAVASLLRYPATASVNGLGIPISSADDLIARFDSIFTAELRCSVDSSVSGGAKSIDVIPGALTFGDGRIRAGDDLGYRCHEAGPVRGCQ